MMKKGCWLVFMDEAYFNPWNISYYSWTPKDGHSAILQVGKGLGFGATCAVTDTGVLYTKLRKGYTSTWEILLFLIDLEQAIWQHEKGKYDAYWKRMLLVLDNASVHLTDKIAHFCRVRGIQTVTLPQYSPEWNPIEKVFRIIKG